MSPLLLLMLLAVVAANDEAPGAKKLLNDLDADGDGTLTKGEIEARLIKIRQLQLTKEFGQLNEAMMDGYEEEEEQVAAQSENFGHEFDELDKDGDHDGFLSEAEVMAAIKAQHEPEEEINEDDTSRDESSPMNPNTDPTDKALADDYTAASLEAEKLTFKAADANGDGKLDKQEWLAMKVKRFRHVEDAMIETFVKLDTRALFMAHDKDANGHLDAEETTAAHDEEYIWYDTHPPHLRDEL